MARSIGRCRRGGLLLDIGRAPLGEDISQLRFGQSFDAADLFEFRQHAGFSPAPDRRTVGVEDFGQPAGAVEPVRVGLKSARR